VSSSSLRSVRLPRSGHFRIPECDYEPLSLIVSATMPTVTFVIVLLIAVLGVCIFMAFDRHPNERLWGREYRRLIAGGASDSEAAAGATDAVWSRDYTERFQGKTVRSIARDPATGKWVLIFEDDTSLPVLIPEEDRSV
jgi:hypothetical protein